MFIRFTYSRWDGTQRGFELDAATLFDQISDDLAYHGDLSAALRRLMQTGVTDADGQRISGLRDLLSKMAERREELLSNHNLGGVYDEVADALNDVIDTERQNLQHRRDEAEASGDERRAELARSSHAEKNTELDFLRPDLAGKVQGLQNYDFTSGEAQEKFVELMEQLRSQLMSQYVEQLTSSVENMTPEDMSRMKDMMAELNRMLEARQNGEEADFEGFMDRYGDFFGENPETLDELLEIMARRMAQMAQMLNSMTPEQRAQLQALSESLMEDMDLAFESARLGDNLAAAFPDMGWDRSFDFSGDDPMGFGEATDAIGQLGELDDLAAMMRDISSPGALSELDTEALRRLLGDEAAESIERLSEMAEMLAKEGLAENRDGKLELTPRGLRRIGQRALSEIFRRLDDGQFGAHEVSRIGRGQDLEYTTKLYEFGDPVRLNIEATVRNAVKRGGTGTPVTLKPADFEVERTSHITDASTVLMLDVSMSMPMRDRFLPAKKVAMALHTLISTKFARDYLGMVTFAYTAAEIKPSDLPTVSWDFEYGTNMHHGLMLARKMLQNRPGSRQILMVTDGEPTAHLDDGGHPHFFYPPAPETVRATLREVGACTKAGIKINTFMLEETSYLRNFIKRMTEINGGRAFFCDPDHLGDFVLVDYLQHRRSQARGR